MDYRVERRKINDRMRWVVMNAETGYIVFTASTRDHCVEWLRDNG